MHQHPDREVARTGLADRLNPGYTRVSMDRSVAHLNVEHYRRLLAVEIDEARRQVLQRLLAEEEAKITGLNSPEKM